MRLEPVAAEVGSDPTLDLASVTGEASSAGEVSSGNLALSFRFSTDNDRWRLTWSLANRGDVAVRPRRARIIWRLVGVPEPLRFFSNGYQSWSRAATATFGIDRDPSQAPHSIPATRDVYLGDPDVVEGTELRSEMVTALGGERGPVIVVGFLGGSLHDGTIRLRRRGEAIELVTEAFLGGATLEPGEQRELHTVIVQPAADPSEGLGAWATEAGRASGARTRSPFQVGWCSWYHYFASITERDIHHNLAMAGGWGFGLFQVDDGYQSAIGDWLQTNERFPNSLETLATSIAAEGLRPGIWLAPFLVAPTSELARSHPEWMVRAPAGDEPLACWLNPDWGGVMWGLDTTLPEVQEHLASVARELVQAGFTYLKLDFTFSPGLDGRFADAGATPAQRVRAGYDAIRAGAGEDVFLLGCGAPLGPCIGVVDGMRIGADVAPTWERDGPALPGLEDTAPATRHALRNTLTRAFMHRRLWMNDPDCLMLRAEALGSEAARAWALAVGGSGGMVLLSDDLELLGSADRELFAEVVSMGRESDAAAIDGHPAWCPDLMERSEPALLRSPSAMLELDPAAGRAVLRN